MEGKPKIALWRKIIFGLFIAWQMTGIILWFYEAARDNIPLGDISFITYFTAGFIYLAINLLLYFMLFKWTIRKRRL